MLICYSSLRLVIFKYYFLIYTTAKLYYYSLIIFLKSIKIETVSEKFINLDDQKILKKRFTVQNFLLNVIERLHSIFKLLNAINQAVVIRKSSHRTMRALEIIHIFYKNELTYKLFTSEHNLILYK